jgi:hypothetical protein
LWQTKGFDELAKGKNLEAKRKRFRPREKIAAKMNTIFIEVTKPS